MPEAKTLIQQITEKADRVIGMIPDAIRAGGEADAITDISLLATWIKTEVNRDLVCYTDQELGAWLDTVAKQEDWMTRTITKKRRAHPERSSRFF